MTPEDVAAIRADDWAPRGWRRTALALCDALEAAWAEMELMTRDADVRAQVRYAEIDRLDNQVAELRERAERAEAQVMREVQLREAQSGEYRAALARVRALCDDPEYPGQHITDWYVYTAEVRAAIEGDSQ